MTITQQTSTITIPATDAQSVLDTVYAQWEQLDARRVELEESIERFPGGLTSDDSIQLEQTSALMRTLEASIYILDDALSAARYAVEVAG